MNITVSKQFSDFPTWEEALIAYVMKLRSGYDVVLRNPQIEFGECLTLIRLGNFYTLFGTKPKNPDYAVVGTEASTRIITPTFATETEDALLEFASNMRLNILRLTFTANPQLGLPECELELNKSQTLLVSAKGMLRADEFAALNIDQSKLR